MGESFAQSAEPGDCGNYSTNGNSTIDSLAGLNEPEESFVHEPDEYAEQDNLDPTEEADDRFMLSEEMNDLEEIQLEETEMPMNMELLHNPHRIREIPKSRSELKGLKKDARDTGSWED